jgi:hypothetical protein
MTEITKRKTLNDKLQDLKMCECTEVEKDLLNLFLSKECFIFVLGQLSIKYPDMKRNEICKLLSDCGFLV